MRLVVVHYHLRPGGVRRVIEEGSCHLVRAGNAGISSIIMAAGERPDATWRSNFKRLAGAVPVRYFIAPGFGYISENSSPPARIEAGIRDAVARLIAGCRGETVVWFHNPGLGRNLPLVRELTRACEAADIPFIAHHHDWWFDNRWQRLPEMRRGGFRALRDVARVIFPPAPVVGHATISRGDAAVLSRGCAAPVGWLPNPASIEPPPAAARVHAARSWLRDRIGGSAPAWVLPCRLLRRKNIAEALLLTRWLNPDAWLVTTGGVSSADELRYADRLAAAARRHRWPLRLSVMRGDERRKPAVAELIAASDAVLLTSLQEGFGLPFIEAAASRRPLIARRLPNIAPDLQTFGFRFPYSYGEILVPQDLFDRPAERKRQEEMFSRWKKALPASCRSMAGRLPLLAVSRDTPVPFSRLTLTAQLEVLAHTPASSWTRCAPLNPFLRAWRRDAMAGKLRDTRWPRQAAQWLGGEAYAHRFMDLLSEIRSRKRRHDGDAGAQQIFIRGKLDADHLFPLLLSTDT